MVEDTNTKENAPSANTINSPQIMIVMLKTKNHGSWSWCS